MSPNPGFHRSPYVRVLELPQTRAWLAAALPHWQGGRILQIGLRDAVVAAELARRGAHVIGMDTDSAAVQRAKDTFKAAKLNLMIDSMQLHCASLTSETGGPLDGLAQDPADVAIVEALPEDAALTVALEKLMKCAKKVIISTQLRPRVPDRFIKDTIETSEFTFTLAAPSNSGETPQPFQAVTLRDDSPDLTHTASADEAFSRAAEEASTESATARVAIVRDGGLSPGRLDPLSLSMREPNSNCKVVATSTRTDRFSREHQTALAPFDEIWVPGASQRTTAIASGMNPAQVRVVPEAVDTYQFQPRPKVQQNFRVLVMATAPERLEEVALAARAFGKTLGSTPGTMLTILCGPSMSIDSTRQYLYNTLGESLPANCELSPAVAHEDMPRFYCDFDVFLRPSSGERRATAILEAMACGVPVAATRFGLGGEIVNIQNGYPIELESLEICHPTMESVTADEAGHRRAVPSMDSICEALRAAHEDWQGRLQRCGAAREYAVRHHSISQVAECIRNIPWEPAVQNTTENNKSAASNNNSDSEPVHYESLADAAAATGEPVFTDTGSSPAPHAEDVMSALQSRELWCYSRLTAEAWIAAGMPATKIQFAPVVVDSGTFQPGVRPAVLPTRRKVRILTDARGEYTSGADLALLAFANAKIQNSALVVMGALAETRASLEKLATAQGNSMEVVFVAEPPSDLARASLICACDVVLDLSRGATSGQFLLEAAACGKAAVAVVYPHPDGIVNNVTGYPVPSRLRISMTDVGNFASPPLFCEACVEEAAKILNIAIADAKGRKARAQTCRAMAVNFDAARMQQFVESRKAAMHESACDEVTITFAATAGTRVPELPDDTEIHLFENSVTRGGLAVDMAETLAATTGDFVIIASGNFTVENEDGGNWALPMVQPLASDPGVALTIAHDANGALVALRPSLLRNVAFGRGFETAAFLLDYARELVERGERVVPVNSMPMKFAKSNEPFSLEAKSVMDLASAMEALRAGESERGLDLLQGIVDKHPNYRAALDCAADVFEALGEAGQAIDARRAAARIAPRDPVAHAKAGELCLSHGEPQDALKHLGAACALAPEDAHVTTLYGKALMKCGRFGDAAEQFLNALNLEPDYTEAATGAAAALQQMGKGTDAATLLKSFECVPAALPTMQDALQTA